MKIQKISLDLDDDDGIEIGLLRLSKKMPEHEFFFHLNRYNPFKFSRVKDLVVEGEYYRHQFPLFEAYHPQTENCIKIIKNQSTESKQLKIQTELFSGEFNVKFLLNNQQDVDYIITASDGIDDFSLILLPENLAFKIQSFSLSSDTELFNLIQYYE